MSKNFLGYTNANLADAKFVILPLPYDITTSYIKGTARGPEAIIEASANVEVYDEELRQGTYVDNLIHTHHVPKLDFQAKADKFIPALNGYMKSFVKRLSKRQVLISLGGEHSLTYPIVSAFQEFRGNNFSVLHLDAHSDLRNEYNESIYSHACVMKRILDAKVKSIVQVGIRNLTPDCVNLINQRKHHNGKTILKTYFGHLHHTYKNMTKEILNSLADDVYVTIDLDVFDPSEMPAVGTPEPGGLGWYQVLDVLRPVFQKKRVFAFDVVELCPMKHSIYSDFTAAKLIYRLMGYLSQH
jgi:agmatinase